MKANTQPPRSVPVLTEVVVMPKPGPEAESEYPEILSDTAYAATQPAGLDEWKA
ncbi:MAG: hypothetical protein H7Y33_07600, partial [Cytophagales bacterium]|nr:hypothetical protein [Rhizobacter sp.]